MPTMDQRVALLEHRVEAIEVAHDRNTEFLVKKVVEHATKLDHLQADVTGLKSDVSGLKADSTILKSDTSTLKSDVAAIKSAIDALPAIIARTMHEVLDARDKRGAH